ncbi:uncharacterized protein [Primulina eburnea]|uniref:uncharacterized protein n=1 Tax=Primulina eburnea TaxID=1245227 RepID=UPI003C6BFE9A
MRVFIKSIEERAWLRVLDGWSPPKIEDADGDSQLKPEKAWDILQKHCEGSESVRKNRLRMVTSKFESLRMEDKESILEYDSRLRQLSNEAHSLGDPMPNERLVNKVLRSLPERFNVKVCAIEESKDTSKINLDELMNSLRTFEMNLDLQRKDKGKTIALEASTESYDEILQISKEVDESDLGEESISLFTKKFGDYLKTMKEKKKIGQKSVLPNITTSAKTQKFTPMKGQFRPKTELQIRSNVRNLDSVQCRECSGYGHYANECANRLRRNKGMTVTLSDEESGDDQGSNESENHTSLSVVIKETRSMQINPLGVATGVAIPGRNTSSNSVCLKSTILGESRIWYFDSGCSRHMTGSKDHLIDYVELRNGHVMYGGGAKGRISGKGTLNVDGLPNLHNVLYVEGLNSNLISTRSANNCYQLGEDLICNHSKVSELNLWHQKLGHENFKTLKNLGKYDAVRDLTGKTIEDDIDGLLNESKTLPNTDVAPGVVTPETTPALAESNDEAGKYTENDDVVTNEEIDIPSKIHKNHPSSQIIGKTFGGMQTRRKEKVDYRKMMGLVCMTSVYSQVSHSCFVSLIEPKNINEALKDEFWVDAMHEELEQFVRNDVWDLVPRPDNVNVIGTK